MLKIGITGGIGSGKTTVCKVFAALGVPIYFADDAAKSLVITDSELKSSIIALLGKEAYLGDGTYNRRFVAQSVFGDEAKLSALNTLIHPVVARNYAHWASVHENYPYTLKEAALLFETGSYRELDGVILVLADLETRIQRVLRRDITRSREEILNIIARQSPPESVIPLAKYLIYNDENHSLLQQVLAIDEQIRLLAKA